MDLADAVLVAGACLLAAYLALVAMLALTGRCTQARAVGGFVPDCAVLFARLARDPVDLPGSPHEARGHPCPRRSLSNSAARSIT
jgi:hypothetical protein